MARSLSSPKFAVRWSGSTVNTMDDASSASVPHPLWNYNKVMTNGVSASQANRAWQSTNRAIASGAQEIIDVYQFAGIDIGGGDGNDGLGQALLLEEIVGIAIINENAVDAAGRLEVFPAASEGWAPIGTHTVATGGSLGGQGVLMKIDYTETGFDVSASSHRITFRASGGDVTYSIYIFGRHDDEESSSSSSSSVSSSSSSSGSSSMSSSSESSVSSSSASSSISTSSISTSSSSISTSTSSPSSASSSSSSSVSSSSSSSQSSSSSSESSSSLSST